MSVAGPSVAGAPAVPTTPDARRRLPRMVAVALTLASALLFGLCFPRARLHLLAWVALVPFLVAIRDAPPVTAMLLAWTWTVAAAYAVGDWFAGSLATYYQQPLVVGVAFFVGVSCLMAAPYYVAFAACYRALARRTGPALPLLAAAAWVAAELGRSRLLTGNPWALFGYSQVGVDAVVQVADVTGVYGVSFALVAVNAALVELWACRRGGRRRALAGAFFAGLVVVGLLAYGRWRLATVEPVPPGARPVTVAMVQGNLDVGTTWRSEFYGRNLDTYLRLTYGALVQARPELVFWPENAFTFFIEEEPLYRHAIARVLVSSGAQLVAGGPRFERADVPRYYNSVFLVSPDGTVLASYDKQHLVPFAEYFPVPALDFLRRRFARVRELTAGGAARLLPTRAGPAGVTICNEAMFPETAAARVRAGAVFLVDPAHDTWLTPKFSAQQFDIVTLRAIEQRRYLIRASTSGPSALVDPLGRVVVRTDVFTRTAITGTVAPRTTVTPYCRVGDLFAYGCVLAVAGALLRRRISFARWRKRH
jgi:apolipoprotein N-acyltransferase